MLVVTIKQDGTETARVTLRAPEDGQYMVTQWAKHAITFTGIYTSFVEALAEFRDRVNEFKWSDKNEITAVTD